ncbi:hypothetical protein SBRY_110139 [Actinacidiphila bryophytorum]|uniref:Uncharacterized protein n=1 Tax=Actinacidiphila bryophytorum TaxID=1436133 RepID=A0A9W4E1M9_9ACTN|nr:hypothetical protein SBRY_110139 [Actinacidiphila bryophytorum]
MPRVHLHVGADSLPVRGRYAQAHQRDSVGDKPLYRPEDIQHYIQHFLHIRKERDAGRIPRGARLHR